jgi:hypothetical protein
VTANIIKISIFQAKIKKKSATASHFYRPAGEKSNKILINFSGDSPIIFMALVISLIAFWCDCPVFLACDLAPRAFFCKFAVLKD